MNIYHKKQKWKIGLGIAAILVIVASLIYTNYLIRKIASEEKAKVKIWAEAIEKKARLVKYTNDLFDKIKLEERKRVEIWAQASKMLTISESSLDLNFYLQILDNNTTIPVILVDDRGSINSWKNIDGVSSGSYQKLTEQEKETLRNQLAVMKLKEQVIRIPLHHDSYNIIYYNESKLFYELKTSLNHLIQSFIKEVVDNYASVPVVITDLSQSKVMASGNISAELLAGSALKVQLKSMASENTPLQINLGGKNESLIFYRDSLLLNLIKFFPFVQLGVIALLIIIGYSLFSTARKAEQDQVWVGMAKETAHQLGTPLSSLIAWNEIIKTKPYAAEYEELEKDIRRLETITERFSKIGSKPVIQKESIREVLNTSLAYMRSRTSDQVKFTLHCPDDLMVACNIPLFEWVLENLIRNAADAMKGVGEIVIQVTDQTQFVYIDVKDTGSGIPRNKFKTVFEPGYTTKKRGWGLGLSLTKRIIEMYHGGKIFVSSSEPGKGTTFRIVLKK